MDRDPLLALMKFGSAANMADLLSTGHLYMRPLAYFRALESDLARGDRDEALTYCKQATGAVLSVQRNGSWHDVGTLQGPIRWRSDEEEGGNVYCMFALRGSHADVLVDNRNLQFGDTAVVFINGDEFLRRARTAATNEGLRLQDGLVSYVDRDTYNGRMGPFRKFTTYAYQSEFRLVARPESPGPRSLYLGSLQDIATMIPLADLNRRLKIVQRASDPA